MAKATPPGPPRGLFTPDLSKPCTACRHYQEPGKWARRLLGAKPACAALPVRRVHLDAVTGTGTLGPAPSCKRARDHGMDIYGGGECGPRGRYWEARDA